jgi:hypothetical protein
MSSFNLKPTHAPVKKYYATLQRFARGHFDKEGNIRGALLDAFNLPRGYWEANNRKMSLDLK